MRWQNEQTRGIGTVYKEKINDRNDKKRGTKYRNTHYKKSKLKNKNERKIKLKIIKIQQIPNRRTVRRGQDRCINTHSRGRSESAPRVAG